MKFDRRKEGPCYNTQPAVNNIQDSGFRIQDSGTTQP
jgi:hypothetical protein